MCEFSYSVEGVMDSLEAFYNVREIGLVMGKDFLEIAKKIDDKYKSIDLNMEMVDFERHKRVGSKLTWKMTIKPNYENSNYIRVKSILDDEGELFERVPEENVIYELKKGGQYFFKGNSEELDEFLKKEYGELENVPKNWAIECDLDIYFYDKYNEIKRSLY